MASVHADIRTVRTAAHALHQQAAVTEVVHSLLGCAAGAAAGLTFTLGGAADAVIVLAGALVGTGFGLVVGRDKGRRHRLLAVVALHHVQVADLQGADIRRTAELLGAMASQP